MTASDIMLLVGHCRRYTEEQLVGVAQRAGFRVEKVLKFNRPGVVAWWLNGRVLSRRTFGLAQVRMLYLLTPIFRVLDSWLPLPPLSLIAILRKANNHAGVGGAQGRLPEDAKAAS